MLCKALVLKKDASRIDNWAAFSFDEPQRQEIPIGTGRRTSDSLESRHVARCAFRRVPSQPRMLERQGARAEQSRAANGEGSAGSTCCS